MPAASNRHDFSPGHQSRYIRPIFLFHVPKTGGTSINLTFENAFGEDSVANLLFTERAQYGQLLAEGAQSSTPFLVTGHISPLALQTPSRFIRTTVLRDPVEHTISHFCYSYKTRHRKSSCFEFLRDCPRYKEGKFSGEDIERWIEHFSCDNYQTRFLSGFWSRPIAPNHLQMARKTLMECDLVGVTEDMACYVAALGQIGGLTIRETVHANQASRTIVDDDADTLRKRLTPHVQLDLALYEDARESFARSKADLRIGQSPPLVTVSERPAYPGFLRRMKSFLQCSRIEKRTRIRFRLASLKGWALDGFYR